MSGEGGPSTKTKKLTLDERLAALTARMQKEEEEERRRVAKQEIENIGSSKKDSDSHLVQPSTQYKRFVDKTGEQFSCVSSTGLTKSIDTATIGTKYQEYVDTPGSPPPEKSTPQQPSTMARRLREYRSRFKVKPKPQATTVTSSQAEKLRSPSTSAIAISSPSQSSTSSPVADLVAFHQPQPPLQQMWQCKICYNRVPTEALFQMHLTTTHFRERIMRRLPRTAPFACLLCQYTPPPVMTDVEKLEDLLMHYGTAERVAAKFYEEVCSDSDEQARVEEKINNENMSRVDCRICDLSLDSDKSLLKHLTLRHFPKMLCDDLPKRQPFRCPYIDCSQARASLHSLMLHYGVDHQVSLEIYQKQKDATVDGFVCSGCSAKPSFTSELLYKQHIILTHLFPNLSSSGPLSCPKCSAKVLNRSEFTSHFLSHHQADLTLHKQHPTPLPRQKLLSPAPPPIRPQCAVVTPYNPESDQDGVKEATSPQHQEASNRVMRTVHSRVARAKVLKNWEDSSLDAQKVKIGELENQIKDMENEYHTKIRDKQSEFERWIVTKEAKIEEEIKKRKSIEEKLAEFEINDSKIKAAEEKLIIQNKTTAVLQKTLSQKIVENNQLTKDFKDAERKLEIKCEELQSFQSKLQVKEEEVQGLTRSYESKVSEVNDLQIIIQDRDDSLSDIQSELKKTEVNLSKIDKSHEKAILALKNKNEKLRRELDEGKEILNHSEVENLKFECDKIREENAALSSKIDDLEQQLKESQERNNASKVLDKEKKELNKKVKQLSSTLADWESRQFTNLKLIAGLEKERDSLQIKLKETQDGKLSHEDQLYWKNVEIKSRGKEIKTLNEKLDEKSTEIDELKELLKSSEAEVTKYKEQVANLEKRIDSTQNNVDIKQNEVLFEENTNLKNEIMHLKMSLNQKKNDLSTLKSTALCQKTELDRLLAENEKIESDYSQAVAQLETLKNTNTDIEGRNKLKDEELRCLKNKLSKSVDKEKVAAMLKAQEDAFHEKDFFKDVEVSELDKINQVNPVNNNELKIHVVKSCSNGIVIKEEPKDEYNDESNVCEFGLKNFIERTEKSIVKEEPVEDEGPGCLNVTDSQIVLNINDADILGRIKSEPQVEEENTEPVADTNKHITIAPWPAFVPLSSHPELSSGKAKKRHSDISTSGKINSKKSKRSLEDVTDQYRDQDTDEEVLCGICNHYDPPLSPENATGLTYTTEWVGCDCDRWFHKPCTKMKRFTDKFSCKSVKMKCLSSS